MKQECDLPLQNAAAPPQKSCCQSLHTCLSNFFECDRMLYEFEQPHCEYSDFENFDVSWSARQRRHSSYPEDLKLMPEEFSDTNRVSKWGSLGAWIDCLCCRVKRDEFEEMGSIVSEKQVPQRTLDDQKFQTVFDIDGKDELVKPACASRETNQLNKLVTKKKQTSYQNERLNNHQLENINLDKSSHAFIPNRIQVKPNSTNTPNEPISPLLTKQKGKKRNRTIIEVKMADNGLDNTENLQGKVEVASQSRKETEGELIFQEKEDQLFQEGKVSGKDKNRDQKSATQPPKISLQERKDRQKEPIKSQETKEQALYKQQINPKSGKIQKNPGKIQRNPESSTISRSSPLFVQKSNSFNQQRQNDPDLVEFGQIRNKERSLNPSFQTIQEENEENKQESKIIALNRIQGEQEKPSQIIYSYEQQEQSNQSLNISPSPINSSATMKKKKRRLNNEKLSNPLIQTSSLNQSIDLNNLNSLNNLNPNPLPLASSIPQSSSTLPILTSEPVSPVNDLNKRRKLKYFRQDGQPCEQILINDDLEENEQNVTDLKKKKKTRKQMRNQYIEEIDLQQI